MSAQKRRRELSLATREVITYIGNIERSPLKVIQVRTKIPTSTISKNARYLAK